MMIYLATIDLLDGLPKMTKAYISETAREKDLKYVKKLIAPPYNITVANANLCGEDGQPLKDN